jgi:folylpolyglutamate synthase/dihydropteroate synthase
MELVLDVAHNPPAAAKLRENLELVYPGRRPVFVVALAGDKDYAHFLEHLLPLAHGFIFPVVDFGRADSQSGSVQPQVLAEEASRLMGSSEHIATCGPISEALELARGDAGPVVITGSFHTVGAALAELGIEP